MKKRETRVCSSGMRVVNGLRDLAMALGSFSTRREVLGLDSLSRSLTRSLSLCVRDFVAILACLLALKGMLRSSSSHQLLIWQSFYVGLVVGLFWSYYMLSLPRFRWDVLWLPFGPLSAASACLYVDHLLKSSREEIRTLRNYMYEYKRR